MEVAAGNRIFFPLPPVTIIVGDTTVKPMPTMPGTTVNPTTMNITMATIASRNGGNGGTTVVPMVRNGGTGGNGANGNRWLWHKPQWWRGGSSKNNGPTEKPPAPPKLPMPPPPPKRKLLCINKTGRDGRVSDLPTDVKGGRGQDQSCIPIKW